MQTTKAASYESAIYRALQSKRGRVTYLTASKPYPKGHPNAGEIVRDWELETERVGVLMKAARLGIRVQTRILGKYEDAKLVIADPYRVRAT